MTRPRGRVIPEFLRSPTQTGERCVINVPGPVGDAIEAAARRRGVLIREMADVAITRALEAEGHR